MESELARSRQVSRPVMLSSYRAQLVQTLNISRELLESLAQFGLLEPASLSRYQHMSDHQERNKEMVEEVVDEVISNSAQIENSYNKLLDVLRETKQGDLASSNGDLDLFDHYYVQLTEYLRGVDAFLERESRRVEIRFSARSDWPGRDLEMPPLVTLKPVQPELKDWEEMTELLHKVYQATRIMLQQLGRSRDVIEKLHTDCADVARKNADNLSKLRDCAKMVDSVVSAVGIKRDVPAGVEHTPGNPVKSSRTRKTETEAFVSAVRKNLTLLTDELLLRDASNRRTAAMVENIVRKVSERRAILCRYANVLQEDGHFPKDTVGTNRPARTSHSSDVLESQVEELAELMLGYVRQESQVTRKVALSKLQQGGQHRGVDQVKEARSQQKGTRGKEEDGMLPPFVANCASSSKGLGYCLKQVDKALERVRARRIKLQDAEKPTARLPRGPTKKIEVASITESKISRRLGDLNKEVARYIEVEMEQTRRFQSDLLKKKQECDIALRHIQNFNKELEKRLKPSRNEMGISKELYKYKKAVYSGKKHQGCSAPRQVAVTFERKGMLRTCRQQRFQEEEEEKSPVLHESRLKHSVKPKLTPRARHLFSEDGSRRKEVRTGWR